MSVQAVHPPRRSLAGLPWPVPAAVAAAWALAAAAEVTGRADLMAHDRLLGGGVPAGEALGLHLGAWTAMVVAMMLPTALPLLRLFRTAAAGQARPAAAEGAVVAGYLLVWLVFGALALLADVALHAAVAASAVLRDAEWALGGLALAGAGAFQFTALKEACLRECRHPAAFLLRHYQRGTRGGLRVGARHGLACVGCCWALMLVLFAVGTASLAWMAVLTAVMVHEKTRPAGQDGVPVTGVALLGLGAVVLAHQAWSAGVV